MADTTAIPTYRCTSCLQALAEDDRQHLFGSYGTQPKSDEADNFVSEAQTIIRYASAVADMCNEAEKKSEETVYRLHQLMGELTDEALRRLERAQEALGIVWEQEEEAKKAAPTREEGV
jgi:hypothetical protein